MGSCAAPVRGIQSSPNSRSVDVLIVFGWYRLPRERRTAFQMRPSAAAYLTVTVARASWTLALERRSEARGELISRIPTRVQSYDAPSTSPCLGRTSVRWSYVCRVSQDARWVQADATPARPERASTLTMTGHPSPSRHAGFNQRGQDMEFRTLMVSPASPCAFHVGIREGQFPAPVRGLLKRIRRVPRPACPLVKPPLHRLR